MPTRRGLGFEKYAGRESRKIPFPFPYRQASSERRKCPFPPPRGADREPVFFWRQTMVSMVSFPGTRFPQARCFVTEKKSFSKALEQQYSNTLSAEDYALHSWYRFVLSYPPHLVRKYLSLFDMRHQGVVLDPFCGTGTTLVEAQKHGFQGIGIDAHPFAAFE